jgi:hypothetical protein
MLALTENSCATPKVVFDNMYRTFDSILNADLNTVSPFIYKVMAPA